MSNNINSNNKKIAKNTILLYIRMFFTMAVGLYASRVVLQNLGISDYGIYNVVGGFVAMLAYLNSVFVAATQRFLAFAVGLNDFNKLKNVFCSSVTVHIFLAIIILIFAETFGLWFLNSQLNIDIERMTAANWVYHFSVLSLMLNIFTIPFNASIVAHEHMNVYAYMSIFDVTAKLAIVYTLNWTSYDKLIIYSILLAFVNLITLLFYSIYCKKKFQECRYHFIIDKSLLKEMFAFSGWTAIGGLGFVFKDQSINIVLNLFFGTTVNAARGVALQVNSIVNQFVSNFMMAVNPQITKSYAANEIMRTKELVYASSKFSYCLMCFIVIPLIVNLRIILKVWLGVVPQYTYEFLIILLISAHIASLAGPIATAINATGRIKQLQIGISLIFLTELPFAYLVLKLGYEPYFALLACFFTQIIALFYRFFVLTKQIDTFCIKDFLVKIICRVIFVFCLSFFLCYIIRCYLEDSLMTIVISTLYSICIIAIIIFIFGLSKTERLLLLNIIRKLNKKNRI